MNDLLDELDNLVANPEILDQNEARANQRKPPFVKVYDDFEADTTITTSERDGKRFLVLNWTNMKINHSDVPWEGTEDSDEMAQSERAVSSMGFFLKSLAALKVPVSKLNGQRAHYKLGLHVPLNRDGTPRQRKTDRGGSFDVQIWYWEVLSVGAGAKSNGAKPAPAFSDTQLDDAAAICVGLSSAEAMTALVSAGYPGPDILSMLLVGSTKRIKQVDGFYVPEVNA